MYDHSDCGQHLRRSVVLLMGIWHPYKQANMLLWQRFGHLYLARLFHALYPTGKYFPKPRLTHILSLLTIFRLSFPAWRPKLVELLESDNCSLAMRPHAQNLLDLGDFFVPEVG